MLLFTQDEMGKFLKGLRYYIWQPVGFDSQVATREVNFSTVPRKNSYGISDSWPVYYDKCSIADIPKEELLPHCIETVFSKEMKHKLLTL